MFKKDEKLDIKIPKEYGLNKNFRGIAVISEIPGSGLSVKTTTI